MKKTFPGLLGAIASGIPMLVDIAKPIFKKKHNDNELAVKSPAELIAIVKQEQGSDEPWYMWLIKRGVTMATVYFVIWASSKLGVSREDIINLFGLLK
jgi:hypothetical protein